MAVKIAKTMGAKVTVLSHSPDKRGNALRLGADDFIPTRYETAFRENARRFDFILDPYRTTQAIRSRSAVLPVAWENITSNPQTFVAGIGYGMEQLHAYGAGPKLVYVDCEILMVWQIGGTLLIAAYGTYLLFLRMRLRGGNWPAAVPERVCIGAAIVALYGGIMLMYGHFFILTTYSHEAPIAYWNLALFGMAVAACSRPREEASVEAEECDTEEPVSAGAVPFN